MLHYECDDNCVKKTCLDPVLGGGASGGVWLLDYGGRKVANGVHVVNDHNGTTWSPHSTKSLLPTRVAAQITQ